MAWCNQCTEVHFASFLSGEITTMAVINPLEKKLAKRTSVHYSEVWSQCLNDNQLFLRSYTKKEYLTFLVIGGVENVIHFK